MNHSMPCLPVHHQLPESTQTHVHWVSDAIPPSHPLSSPSPPALNISQHQGLFKRVLYTSAGQNIGVSASTSVLPMNTQDWSPLIWTSCISLQSKGLLQHHSSKASILWHSAFFIVQFSHLYMTTGKTIVSTRQTFVDKVMSLLFNTLSRLVIRRRQWHPTPVLLPGKSHGWRSLEGCSPWSSWGSDMTERLHFHFLLSCIGEGNGNPLQCSCLENPRDGGAWWVAIYGVTQSRTLLKWLSSSSRLVITFFPRSKCLLISWLQSPSALILEPNKIKSDTVSPSISHEVMGPDAMIFVFWMLSFKLTFHSPVSLSSRGSLVLLHFLP